MIVLNKPICHQRKVITGGKSNSLFLLELSTNKKSFKNPEDKIFVLNDLKNEFLENNMKTIYNKNKALTEVREYRWHTQ